MDLRNWYFFQFVGHDDMRDLEARVEAVDKRIITDLFKGQLLVSGLAGSQNTVPDLTVLISAGTAYDGSGNRIYVGTGQQADLSSYLPTLAEVWVTVTAKFVRVLSDPKTDGFNQTVQYKNDEGFAITITKGVEATSGNAVKPTPPNGEVVLFDILLTNGMTQILNANLNVSRRNDNVATGHSHNFSSISGRYKHTQSLANATWTVDHNLGTIDHMIQVFDNVGNGHPVGFDDVIRGTNQDTITFVNAQAGTALLIAIA